MRCRPHASQRKLPHQLLQMLIGVPQVVKLSAGLVSAPSQRFLLLKRRAGGIAEGHDIEARACGGTLSLTGWRSTPRKHALINSMSPDVLCYIAGAAKQSQRANTQGSCLVS